MFAVVSFVLQSNRWGGRPTPPQSLILQVYTRGKIDINNLRQGFGDIIPSRFVIPNNSLIDPSMFSYFFVKIHHRPQTENEKFALLSIFPNPVLF